MYYSKVADETYLLRLTKGEETVQTLKNFCRKESIHNGSLQGIGSIERAILAHYTVDNKKYHEENFEGIYEVTSLLGNIALFDDEPLIHAHITLTNGTMNAFGGHLVKAIVSATLEVIIKVFDSKHTKSFNEEIGLKLWDLAETI